MAYLVFDFVCPQNECVKFNVPVEIVVDKAEDRPRCNICDTKMVKVFLPGGAPKIDYGEEYRAYNYAHLNRKNPEYQKKMYFGAATPKKNKGIQSGK